MKKINQETGMSIALTVKNFAAQRAFYFLALMLVLALGGCHHMSYTTLPGSLVAEKNLEYQVVGNFEIEVEEYYFFNGFGKMTDEKVADAIVQKVKSMGGNGVRDLHYKVEFSATDVCLSACASIATINRQTIIVTGTVVKIQDQKSKSDSLSPAEQDDKATAPANTDTPDNQNKPAKTISYNDSGRISRALSEQGIALDFAANNTSHMEF